MARSLDGRRALVTGAAGGIGRATVLGFLREGATVIAADFASEVLASEYSGVPGVHTVVVDVASEDAPAKLVAAAREIFDGLDILVNNAGIGGAVRPIYDTNDNDWNRTVSVNMSSVYRITRDFVPLLMSSGQARVINTASVASSYAIDLLGVYAASKHGVLGLTKAFARELGKFGITVNCVEPANILTGISRDFLPSADSPAGREFLSVSGVVGRYGQPEDVAGAILYLASDAASFVTGIALPVDGGMTCRLPDMPKM